MPQIKKEINSEAHFTFYMRSCSFSKSGFVEEAGIHNKPSNFICWKEWLIIQNVLKSPNESAMLMHSNN